VALLCGTLTIASSNRFQFMLGDGYLTAPVSRNVPRADINPSSQSILSTVRRKGIHIKRVASHLTCLHIWCLVKQYLVKKAVWV